MKYFQLLILFCASLLSLDAQESNDKNYNRKDFETLYDLFQNKNDLIKFMDIKPGEVIADVGGDDGHHMGSLSLIYDDLTFYIEDVDPKLNAGDIEKMAKKFSKKRATPQTCKFNWVLGSYTATNLPDGMFDKIIMIASFHEFTEMDAMIKDISKKLKPGGKLYIMEAFCIDKVIYCEDKHKGYYMREVNEIMNKQCFYQIQQSSPESDLVNYANCLVFSKDEKLSEQFIKNKQALQSYIDLSKLFGQKLAVENENMIIAVADTLAQNANQISDLYVVYEVWMRGIAASWETKGEMDYAITIYKALTTIFPNSAYNYYLLGEAYTKDSQTDLATEAYKKACKLGLKEKMCEN
jgi:ubiquinone/menaquinone biosynthesis C-methylase UbiE